MPSSSKPAPRFTPEEYTDALTAACAPGAGPREKALANAVLRVANEDEQGAGVDQGHDADCPQRGFVYEVGSGGPIPECSCAAPRYEWRLSPISPPPAEFTTTPTQREAYRLQGVRTPAEAALAWWDRTEEQLVATASDSQSTEPLACESGEPEACPDYEPEPAAEPVDGGALRELDEAMKVCGMTDKARARVRALTEERDRAIWATLSEGLRGIQERSAREQAEASAARRLDELVHAQQAANAAARQCDGERARREKAERERDDAIQAALSEGLRGDQERAAREKSEAKCRDIHDAAMCDSGAKLARIEKAERERDGRQETIDECHGEIDYVLPTPCGLKAGLRERLALALVHVREQAEATLAEALAKSAIDERQCEEMTARAGELAEQLARAERDRDEARRQVKASMQIRREEGASFGREILAERSARERAEAERDEARDLYTETEKKHCAALTKLDAAEAEVERLREALRHAAPWIRASDALARQFDTGLGGDKIRRARRLVDAALRSEDPNTNPEPPSQ